MTATRYRRLAPVNCMTVWGFPDGVHLSVEEWEPKLGEWVTGLALCGQSAEQGALRPDTPVTCRDCEDYRDSYERALVPASARVTDHTYDGTPGVGNHCQTERFGETCAATWEQHELRDEP